jgi:ribonuclease D
MIQRQTNYSPIWVDRPEILNRMVTDLSHQQLVALDTESNSLFAYQEQVCLVQVSTESTNYLIDTLALRNLSPLIPIINDPHIEKIFHAAEYDLICLKRDFGFQFNHIFDTMVSGRILGKTSLSLGGILEEEFNLVLDKGYQRANWGMRPLPPKQLIYAVEDVHYLIPLRHRLQQELESKGLWLLAQEDFNRLCNMEAPEYSNSGDVCIKVDAHRDLTSRQMTILTELCRYRDQQARKTNLPPFKVIGKETLIDLAVEAPHTVEELRQIPHMTPRVISRHGEGLLQAIDRGLKGKLVQKPTCQRRDERMAERIERLRSWRKRTAQMQGVESDVILPKDTLEAIALADPKNLTELAITMQAVPWRYQHYGQQILSVLNS